MSERNKKQFGVWMDKQHATVVGREKLDTGDFVVLGHEKIVEPQHNPNESNSNHADNNAFHRLFKDITMHMQNVDEVHVTGPGTAQEQFIHWLAASPHYKNVVAKESTSNKMSDESLIKYISEKFN